MQTDIDVRWDGVSFFCVLKILFEEETYRVIDDGFY